MICLPNAYFCLPIAYPVHPSEVRDGQGEGPPEPPRFQDWAKTIYLSDLAVELLRVPPGKRIGSSSAGGRSGTSRSRACRRNGSASERSPACRTVRLNDLRHRYASLGVEDPQLSLSMIGGLLGHKEPRTTARYAHLSAHPMRKAANRIGARFLEAINASTPEKADLER